MKQFAWQFEDWGKLIGDVPSATAILDRFLHHAEVVSISGRSYRLRNQAATTSEQPSRDKGEMPPGESNPAISPTPKIETGKSSKKPGSTTNAHVEKSTESTRAESKTP